MRHRVMGMLAVVAVLPVAGSGGLSAQAAVEGLGTEAMRTYLLEGFQRNLELDLAYLESAPDSMLRWAPTEGVRDFAEQIAHTTHDFFRPWREGAPEPADAARYLNDREVLAHHLRGGYGWVLERIEAMTTDDFNAVQSLGPMGEYSMWRVFVYWIEHAMWTRATTVSYLRMNGVVPPRVRFFKE